MAASKWPWRCWARSSEGWDSYSRAATKRPPTKSGPHRWAASRSSRLTTFAARRICNSSARVPPRDDPYVKRLVLPWPVAWTDSFRRSRVPSDSGCRWCISPDVVDTNHQVHSPPCQLFYNLLKSYCSVGSSSWHICCCSSTTNKAHGTTDQYNHQGGDHGRIQ